VEIENPPREGNPGRAGEVCLSRHSQDATNSKASQAKPASRSYQIDIVDQEKLLDHPLIPLPTGGSKTIIAAAPVREAVTAGLHVISVCRVCGWKPETRPCHLEVATGDLSPVQRDRSVHVLDQGEISFHRQLVAIAQEKRRKMGWVSHAFKGKFGHFPRQHHVSPRFRAWVKSRDIAHAKPCEAAMQAREATMRARR
jgi:hypothetical protein